MATIYGYNRVSTDLQENESQRMEIESYANTQGLTDIRWIQETISSRKADRDLYRLINTLQPGDVILATEFSRLSRGGMIELADIVSKIRAAKADLVVVRGGHIIKATGDMDIAAQALLFAFGIASQIERDQISLRTKAGMAIRKAAGYKGTKPAGRPEGYRKLEGKRAEIDDLLQIGVSKVKLAKRYEVTRVTLDKFLKG